ncbi:hypothetical protein E2562_003789 [Oryza meyeriana var. granulata]|uniref:Uncharacterized protein n=1 Tax=Oryza meyeriana var. granulata TaxID=110450 RepID=A0A6G1BRJ5_9ORYZ|nr:hypothetical protein E2562_003789 [Oryza meyeriana var. granulata]
MQLDSKDDALSLISAVLVSEVPLTVVPEPARAQCSELDREGSQLIIEGRGPGCGEEGLEGAIGGEEVVVDGGAVDEHLVGLVEAEAGGVELDHIAVLGPPPSSPLVSLTLPPSSRQRLDLELGAILRRPPFDPVPYISTDSKPIASDGGCASDKEYTGERNSECPLAAEESARAFGWLCSPGSWQWSAPLFRWCSMWWEEVNMQKECHPLSWKKRQPVVDRHRFLPGLPLFPLFLVLIADTGGDREDGAEEIHWRV